LKQIDFTVKTNKKSSKHDRSKYYGRFIIIYNELLEVANKASGYNFYDYKGAKLRDYQQVA
jgi:hypothetical protein